MQRNKILRAGLALLLCLAAVLGAVLSAAAQAMPEVPELASEAAVLIDAQTGQVLFGKNAHQRMYPASITKIMTGLLALENLDPQQVLTVSQAAYDAVPRTSSHISLEPGQTMTVSQAMYALALESANDAANVLGEAVSGSLEAFGQRMTERARALGAEDTHFTNANGLPDEDHYTTAYDMALIAAAALKTPGFTEYFGQVAYSDGTYWFDNANRMLSGAYRYEGVLMSKTGWTSSAWGTLVTAVQKGDTTLIAVVLKSLATESKYIDTWALLDYGFQGFRRVRVSADFAAEQLELGEYMPMAGQDLELLIPADAAISDIQFTLATDLRQVNAEQPAVVLNARVGNAELPGMALVLVRRPPEPETGESPEDTADRSEAVEVTDLPEAPNRNLLWIPAGILAAAGWLLYRRSAARRTRRRILERRIRQMKKRMDTPDEEADS